jgi:NDP-sugar pyrophosphorylase family protein
MINTAVIMAAGNGSRLHPISKYIPKPLIEIDGKPLIVHCINELKKNGIDNIYVTYGYKSDLIISNIANKVTGFINTTNFNNSYFIFNTIVKNINENILILPCDIIFNLNINKLNEEIKNDGSYIVPIEYKSGMDSDYIKFDKNKNIKSINRNNKTEYCASGIQVCNPFQINNDLKNADNWYQIWNHLIEKDKLFATNLILEKWKTYDTIDQILKHYESF